MTLPPLLVRAVIPHVEIRDESLAVTSRPGAVLLLVAAGIPLFVIFVGRIAVFLFAMVVLASIPLGAAEAILRAGPWVLLGAAILVFGVVAARGEQLRVDDDGIAARPLFGRRVDIEWSAIVAIQWDGSSLPERGAAIRTAAVIAVAVVILSLVELHAVAIFLASLAWLVAGFRIGGNQLSIGVKGAPLDDPGPNLPRTVTLWTIVGERSSRLISEHVLAVARGRQIPAWSTWDDATRVRPRY